MQLDDLILSRMIRLAANFCVVGDWEYPSVDRCVGRGQGNISVPKKPE